MKASSVILVLAAMACNSAAFHSPTAPGGQHALCSQRPEGRHMTLYACIPKSEILKTPNTLETGRVWDPIGLASLGSAETLAWFRHAEIKHGRVAMAAFVGWWVLGSGLHFPGELSHGLYFGDLPTTGLEAWASIPMAGKVQMVVFCGLVEFFDELSYKPHYLRGGMPGMNFVPGLYDPFDWWADKSEAERARGRDVELKNGRLAMIAVAALFAEATIPGSVPLQPLC